MFLDCGRKLEHTERTQADTARTCKHHTEMPWPRIEPRTFLLWGDDTYNCAAIKHRKRAFINQNCMCKVPTWAKWQPDRVFRWSNPLMELIERSIFVRELTLQQALQSWGSWYNSSFQQSKPLLHLCFKRYSASVLGWQPPASPLSQLPHQESCILWRAFCFGRDRAATVPGSLFTEKTICCKSSWQLTSIAALPRATQTIKCDMRVCM